MTHLANEFPFASSESTSVGTEVFVRKFQVCRTLSLINFFLFLLRAFQFHQRSAVFHFSIIENFTVDGRGGEMIASGIHQLSVILVNFGY